jgi:DNA polymerase-3 subunit alpha
MYLNAHSHFSLRYGVMSPEALLQQAKACGVDCMALTDINNSSAGLDFVRLAPKFGIRPVLGVDFRNGNQRLYVLLASDNVAYQAINAYLSAHLHAGEAFPRRPPVMAGVYVIYPLSNWDGRRLEEHEYLGIAPHECNRLRVQGKRWPQHRLVALATATFRNKRDWNVHRLLRAIDKNTLLSKLDAADCGREDEQLRPLDSLLQGYDGFPELLYRTRQLLDRCRITFEYGEQYPHKNLRTYTGNEELDYRLMRHLAYQGLSYRYPQAGEQVLTRLEKELEIIRQKRFVSYFLINWKILKYARSKGYFYVGRGSGANSVVAYLLRITDVDPIELDLYFERFINLYRRNPPDFDIDFSWADRDDVTHFIFARFPHVALLGTYVTFQYRAVVRELGKVFGLPKADIDQLADGKFDPNKIDRIAQTVLQYGSLLQDLPNHLSIHAGGILILDRPVHYFSGTFLPPKGFPTTMFDMVVAEDAGLYKFDILSQRGLGKIKDALWLIRENGGDADSFDIHDIARFKQDERIKHMLRNAKAIGCFYVESPAMRMLMKKLRVDDYLGLVAASSVIRPGVSNSGMMRQYILRYRFPERRKDAHPVMLDIMPETYGVMVYQEDVIKVAHYFAGLSLAEADVLRRGMSGKFRGREEFEQVRDKFFRNCKEKGYSAELSAEIWRQVESFAGYAFAKGHSASYAVESYQSLFLKAYYPLEYMVATLNNAGGFYSIEHYLHEARMHGAEVQAPCVNRSKLLCRLEGSTIWLGLGFVKGLETTFMEKIMDDRSRLGPFPDLAELVQRLAPPLEQLAILIRIGAFRFTGKNKKELLWQAHLLLGHAPRKEVVPELFYTPPRSFSLPELDRVRHEDAFDEMELLGFALCSPFELLLHPAPAAQTAAELMQRVGKEAAVVGYLVTVKDTRTAKGERMQFGTFIDKQGEYIDTVHFPPVAARYPFRGRGIYWLKGRVTEEFDCYTLEVMEMEKLPIIPDPRYAEPARQSATQSAA